MVLSLSAPGYAGEATPASDLPALYTALLTEPDVPLAAAPEMDLLAESSRLGLEAVTFTPLPQVEHGPSAQMLDRPELRAARDALPALRRLRRTSLLELSVAAILGGGTCLLWGTLPPGRREQPRADGATSTSSYSERS
jgi:hypothetical protein